MNYAYLQSNFPKSLEYENKINKIPLSVDNKENVKTKSSLHLMNRVILMEQQTCSRFGGFIHKNK